ncbi:twin-arginine translocase subunit TatC [Mucilaginibacter auburnensis]|uniref:Sec-independent protein translocase protein TatC n=1 Tax=Mucilaginibacter auburnensis TaxID=1457233 RepID=A0A2H9VR30_9SPHI|nr:twin-arginine translocase subunit TatC [Mucilaginibacter auburnensis]PJJ83228.1 sec-independent protein translocase protein TatC [Mucilaginibacter auburnensis]
MANKLVDAIKDKGKNLEAEMSFFEHLEALRWHLIRSVIALLIFTTLAFYFSDFVIDGIVMGPRSKDFWTYRMMCKLGTALHMDGWCFEGFKQKMIATELGANFNLMINICIVSGLILAIPYFLYEVWKFIKPALHEKERKAASGFVLYASGLFLLGVLFGYYIVAPLSIRFLIGFKVSEQIETLIRVDSYMSTLTTLTLGSGIVFELPILIYLLASLGILNAQLMRRTRRYAILIIMIISAIITPTPDAITMSVVAVPLLLLYEVGIWVAAGVGKRREKKTQELMNS